MILRRIAHHLQQQQRALQLLGDIEKYLGKGAR
jgi:hypothetical protein